MRIRFAVASGLAGLAVLATQPGPRAGAQQLATYDATASAYGFDVTIANPSIPLGLTIQAAGPTAQARQTSLGSSDAFASFPYLGETVTGLPGLVNSLFGTPLPPYPLYVDTQAGNDPEAVTAPGVALRAESGETATTATASAGGSTPGYESSARVERSADDTVTASALTALSGLDLGGLLRVDAMRSSAEAVLRPDGTVERSSSLELGGISIPGLAITIPRETPSEIPIPIPIPIIPQPPPIEVPPLPIPFGGQTLIEPSIGFRDGSFIVSLPLAGVQEFALPAGAVLAGLEALGIAIAYQAATEFTGPNGESGIVAPALEFRTVLPAPPENPVANGPTEARVVFGRTTAIAGGTVSDASAPSPPSVDTTAAPDLGSFPSVGGVPIGGGSTPVAAGSPGAPVSPPRPVAAPLSGDAEGTGVRVPLDRDAMDLYLVLVGVGLVGLSASQAVRILGVRFPWTL